MALRFCMCHGLHMEILRMSKRMSYSVWEQARGCCFAGASSNCRIWPEWRQSRTITTTQKRGGHNSERGIYRTMETSSGTMHGTSWLHARRRSTWQLTFDPRTRAQPKTYMQFNTYIHRHVFIVIILYLNLNIYIFFLLFEQLILDYNLCCMISIL